MPLTPEERFTQALDEADIRSSLTHGTAYFRLRTAFIKAIREAVAAEREACFQIADAEARYDHEGDFTARQIAEAIRARGQDAAPAMPQWTYPKMEVRTGVGPDNVVVTKEATS